jgi:hypothetical protein
MKAIIIARTVDERILEMIVRLAGAVPGSRTYSRWWVCCWCARV